MLGDLVYIGRCRRPVEARVHACQPAAKGTRFFLSLDDHHGCHTEATGERAVQYAGYHFF